MGAKYVVQVFLLGTVVLALACHVHSEEIAVEPDTGVRVPHYDCGMVDTEEHLVRGTMPLLLALVGREVEHFYWVLVGILEVERRDARGILVPVRKALRFCGRILYLVVAQPGICLV